MLNIFSAVEVVVCESNTLSLSCSGTKVIRISSAVYGHYDHKYCRGKLGSDRCHQDGDFDVIDGLCSGQGSCDIYVDNFAFSGDPCSGTRKYLHVHYMCISGEYYIL